MQATRALLRALQHLPPLRKLWGLHSVQPFQALLESSEPDVRWLAVECLALIAGLVSWPDHEPAALSIARQSLPTCPLLCLHVSCAASLGQWMLRILVLE